MADPTDRTPPPAGVLDPWTYAPDPRDVRAALGLDAPRGRPEASADLARWLAEFSKDAAHAPGRRQS